MPVKSPRAKTNSDPKAQLQQWLDGGQLDEAEAGAQHLLAVDPDDEAALCTLGTVHLHRQQFAQAREQFYMATLLHPNSVDALCGLGMAAQSSNQYDEAVMAYRQALELAPDEPELHRLLAVVLAASGHEQQAVEAQKRFEILASSARLRDVTHAGKIPPVTKRQVEVWQKINDQSNALINEEQYAEAERLLRQGLKQFPNVSELHANLSVALLLQLRMRDAAEHARRAIALKPNRAFAYANLANALLFLPDLDGAEQAQRDALRLDPDLPRALITLATILRKQGRTAEFEAILTQALAKQDKEAPFMWASHLLRGGRFAEGWRAYEARPSKSKRAFDKPEWDGSPLNGRTLLVHAEQGFGDVMQMARFLPLVKAQGGRVLFECQEELARLMQRVSGWDELLLSRGHKPLHDAHCDVHAFLMSLPHLLHLDTEAQITPSVSYLSADPQRVTTWEGRFAPDGSKTLRVGIVWACGNRSPADLLRSASLEAFAALMDVPNVQFYSLQKGNGERELTARAAPLPLVNLAPDLNDFADTAAAMMHLDLIITVDTAAAHLAGALGRPVWTLLPFDSDWRWLLEREDTPWYASMRLFRQTREGDWPPVFGQVYMKLKRLAEAWHPASRM